MAMLVRPEPLSTELDRLFTSIFGEPRADRWLPAMDLYETDDAYVLKVDLPGLSEKDVSIEVENGVLTVSGERRSEREERRDGWLRAERAFGRFSRSLTLPEGVDPSRITAEFDKGVLTVRVPKPEQHRPHRIQIRAADGSESRTLEGEAREKA